MRAREAAWPLILIKPQKSLKLEACTCRCKCMAYKPWAHFWAGYSGCSPYPRARFSHLCVPRATLPAVLPPPACALQLSVFVKHLLCVGLALGAWKGVVSKPEAAPTLRERNSSRNGPSSMGQPPTGWAEEGPPPRALRSVEIFTKPRKDQATSLQSQSLWGYGGL